ncbi:hypothetical protein D3C81_1227310 [compost metagenome]
MMGEHLERPFQGIDRSRHLDLAAQQFEHTLTTVETQVDRGVGVEQQRAAVGQAKLTALTHGGTKIGKQVLRGLAAQAQPAQGTGGREHQYTAQHLAPGAISATQRWRRQGTRHTRHLLADVDHALPGLAMGRIAGQPVVPGGQVGIAGDTRTKSGIPAGSGANRL